jgi:sugar O-acyltransferase (sialic acid O-acetyltransferase NeuD family)
MKGLLIIGAGGHGKVVADAALQTGNWDKIAFVDDNIPVGEKVLSFPVLGKTCDLISFIEDYHDLAVAIGDNSLRVRLIKNSLEKGFSLPVVIHPGASVSRHAAVEDGTVIFSQAVVHPGARIGLGAIINTSATVDHDCVLGDGVHLSPGVHLGGEVRIGNYSWLGIGTSVINQMFIGDNVIVGAGSVIVNHIDSGMKVAGVPGRVIGKNDETE